MTVSWNPGWWREPWHSRAGTSRPRAAVGLLVVLVLAACTTTDEAVVPTGSPPPAAAESSPAPAESSPAPAESSPSGVPGLSAVATASTLFDTQRTFRLELSQVGSDVEIRSLQLSSPWYEPVEPVARELRLGDGARRLVPLPYGPAACDSAMPMPVEGSIGEVVVTTAVGVTRVPLADHPPGLVAGRHGRECAAAAAGEAVGLAFGRDWTPADPRAVTGTVRVEPRSGGSVEVVRVEGNIVFTLDLLDPGEEPVVAAGTAMDLPVRVAAARCDTHALIEAKRSFHHLVEVAIDDAEPVVMDLEATGDTRRLFQSLLEACLAQPGQ